MSFNSFVHMAMKTCRRGGVGDRGRGTYAGSYVSSDIPFSEDLCLCFSCQEEVVGSLLLASVVNRLVM